MEYENADTIIPEVIAECPEAWQLAWEEQVAAIERGHSSQSTEDVFLPTDSRAAGCNGFEHLPPSDTISHFTRMPRPSSTVGGRFRRSAEKRNGSWEGNARGGVSASASRSGGGGGGIGGNGSGNIEAASGEEVSMDTAGYDDDEASGSSQSGNPRYKTEICRNFKERSRCIYGDQCQFAHGRRELRDVVRNTKYKTKLCQKYWMTGYCAYGPRCNFLHNESDSVEQPQKPHPPHRSHHHRHHYNHHHHQGRPPHHHHQPPRHTVAERSVSVGDESIFFGGGGCGRGGGWEGSGTFQKMKKDGGEDTVFSYPSSLQLGTSYQEQPSRTMLSHPPKSAPPMPSYTVSSPYPFEEGTMESFAGVPWVDTWSETLLDGDETV